MSQHDLEIANQGFPATRADINSALQALGSLSSGATAPATTYVNQLWYDTANNVIKIRNEDNDAWISLMTLDQAGDLVTRFDVDNIRIDGNTISSTDTNGDITLDPNGTGDVIIASGNDGTLVNLAKDGTTVGSIGTVSSDICLSSDDVGLRFDGSYDHIIPVDGSYSTRDNAIDLGYSGGRFKDLYLSGGAYIGGTAAANALDDYEEGTWTPVYSLTSGSATMGSQAGRYVKVGDMVTIWATLSTGPTSSPSGTVEITGVPYTADSAGAAYGWSNAVNATWSWNDHPRSVYVTNSGSVVRLWDSETGQITGADMFSSGNNIIFQLSYRAA